MTVAEHGDADNATTATGGHPGNLVVPADNNGVGHVDLSCLLNPMTTGFGGTEAEVIITVTRSDDPTHPILSDTYDDLTAGGTLQSVEVALPTTDTAADFTITAALAGATPITDLCMAAPPVLTAGVTAVRPRKEVFAFEGRGGYSGISAPQVKDYWKKAAKDAGPDVMWHYYAQDQVRQAEIAIGEIARSTLVETPRPIPIYPTITILGYSNGGDAALEVATYLKQQHVAVDLAVTCDPVPKPGVWGVLTDSGDTNRY